MRNPYDILEPLKEEDYKLMIFELQQKIFSLEKKIDSVRSSVNNDMQDNWQMISDLSKEVERCKKK